MQVAQRMSIPMGDIEDFKHFRNPEEREGFLTYSYSRFLGEMSTSCLVPFEVFEILKEKNDSLNKRYRNRISDKALKQLDSLMLLAFRISKKFESDVKGKKSKVMYSDEEFYDEQSLASPNTYTAPLLHIIDKDNKGEDVNPTGHANTYTASLLHTNTYTKNAIYITIDTFMKSIVGGKFETRQKLFQEYFIDTGLLLPISESRERHASLYKLNTKFQTKRIQYSFIHPEAIQGRIRRNKLDMFQYLCNQPSELRRFVKTVVSHMHFPTWERVLTKAEYIVRTKQNIRGKEYVFAHEYEDFYQTDGTKNEKYSHLTDIQDSLDNYHRFLTEGAYFYDKVKDTRMCHSLTSMASWIREMCLLDGEPMKECEADYTSLHPRLIGKAVKADFLIGDVHTNLSKKLGVERSVAKLLNLKYWNSEIENGKTVSSKANRVHFKMLDKMIQGEYPELWEWMLHMKSESHTNMSKWLLKHERRLLNKALEAYDFTNMGIYLYDALYVPKDVRNAVMDMMNKHFDEYVIRVRTSC